METHSVPARFLTDQSSDNNIVFVPYLSSAPLVKGRAILDRHMISLITEGEKVVHVENKTIHLTPDHILLLAAGNVLFTERLGKNARIKSTMIFFDDNALLSTLNQFNKYHKSQSKKDPYVVVDRDDYLRNFVESVNSLVEQRVLSGPLQHAKFNELLAYLNSRYPDLLSGFGSASARPEEERLRQVMEAQLSEKLTLAELAFLCHMSLPTFKRRFEQIYHKSPARWLQIQRLRLAANQLRLKTAKPGELYIEAGYENHSSFSRAFKQHFGVLPKDYAH